MSAHSHWKDAMDSAHVTTEMVAWNSIARILIAGDTPVVSRDAVRVRTLAANAGYAEADKYLSMVDGLSQSEIESDSELSYAQDQFSNPDDGGYLRAISRSEDLLLSICRAEDPEAQSAQRHAISEIAQIAREAYLAARENRIGLPNAANMNHEMAAGMHA